MRYRELVGGTRLGSSKVPCIRVRSILDKRNPHLVDFDGSPIVGGKTVDVVAVVVGRDHNIQMWCAAAVLGQIADDVLYRLGEWPRGAVGMDTAVDQHPPRFIAASHRDPEGIAESDVIHPHFDRAGRHHAPP